MRARMSFGAPLERCENASGIGNHELTEVIQLRGGTASSEIRAQLRRWL
jgi:hypothetical protein